MMGGLVGFMSGCGITEYEDLLLSNGGTGGCANDGDDLLYAGCSLGYISVCGCFRNLCRSSQLGSLSESEIEIFQWQMRFIWLVVFGAKWVVAEFGRSHAVGDCF